MDEHSNEIIIILTGYKDKIYDSIFKAQPGLERRIQWYFDLKGYTPDGLSQIFIKQLYESNWKVNDNEFVTKFFHKNFDKFPHFGGDTLKLVYNCKLVYSQCMIESMFNSIDKIDIDLCLNENILNVAFHNYLSNMIKS
jgi:hypothetical protein